MRIEQLQLITEIDRLKMIKLMEELHQLLTTHRAIALLQDHVVEYAPILLSALNPPLGLVVDLSLTMTSINADNWATEGVLLYVESILSKRLGSTFSRELAEITAKMAMNTMKRVHALLEIPSIKNSISDLVILHLLRKKMPLSGATNVDLTTFFGENAIPNMNNLLSNVFNDAIKKIVTPEKLLTLGQPIQSTPYKNALDSLIEGRIVDFLGVDVSKELQVYQKQFTPLSWAKLNDEIHHIVGMNIEKYSLMSIDDSMSYFDLTDGRFYVGRIGEYHLPQGQGLVISSHGYQKTSWDKGVQIKQNSIPEWKTMLPNIAAVVSIVGTILQLKATYEQTEHLKSIHNLMQSMLTMIEKIPVHIDDRFDQQVLRDSFTRTASAIVRLKGIDMRLSKDADNRLNDSLSEMTNAFNRVVSFNPHGQDPLLYSTIVDYTAVALGSTLILQTLYFPTHKAEMIAQLGDLINSLEDYVYRQNLIRGKFTEARVELTYRYKWHYRYNGDLQYFSCPAEICHPHNSIWGYLSQQEAEKGLSYAISKHKGELGRQMAARLGPINKTIYKFLCFLADFTFIDITGGKFLDHEKKSLPSVHGHSTRAVSPYQYYDSSGQEAGRVENFNAWYKKMRNELLGLDVTKKELINVCKKMLGKNCNNLDFYISRLKEPEYDYYAMCLSLAESKEGQLIVEESFPLRFSTQMSKTEWTKRFSQLGISALYTEEALLFQKRGDTYQVQGMPHLAKNDYNSAIKFYEMSFLHPDSTCPVCELANRFNNLAISLYDQGNYEQAILFFGKALEKFSSIEPKSANVAKMHSHLGRSFSKKGDQIQSEMHYKKALDIRVTIHKTDNNLVVASSLYDIGNALYSQAKYDEAKVYYERGVAAYRKIHEQRDHSDIASGLNKLGNILGKKENYVQASK